MLWSEVFACDCIICELGSLVKERFNYKDIYRILRQNRLIFDTHTGKAHTWETGRNANAQSPSYYYICAMEHTVYTTFILTL